MHVFVTGADGFLGGAIAEAFASAGASVARWGKPAGPLTLTGLEQTFCGQRPDLVIHAAGPSAVGPSMSNPLGDFQRGSGSTAEVLEAVRRWSPEAGVIFLSSGAVYGNPQELPVTETARLHPLSPYGFHKWISEVLLEEYRTVFGLRCISLRIFSAYGDGLRKQVLWDVCRKAVAGKLILQGDGSQSRDFIHRDDVASAVRHLADLRGDWPPVVNLAFGAEVTIAQAADWIRQELGYEAPVAYDGIMPAGNPQRWRADIRLMKSLGWSPRVPPEEGIRAFARWAVKDLQKQS